MPLITETYYLSLTQDNRGILRLRCSQDDTLRTVNLKLYNNGSIFVIPSGVSASISGVKQNGAVFSKPCTISQDRESVVLQLSSDITNIDGIIVAEIVLNDGEGERLGTSNFIIQVEKNPIRAGVVQDTETPIEYINDFIEKIQMLTARLNNLITPNGDPSLAEVVDARISSLDSNAYPNIKARIDADITALSTGKANKIDVQSELNNHAGSIEANANAIAGNTASLNEMALESMSYCQELEVDSEGLVYLINNGERIAGPYGPFAGSGGGSGGGGGNNATLTVSNTTGWMSTTIAAGAACIVSLTWSSTEDDVPTGSGSIRVTVNNAVKASTNVQQGAVSIDLSPYLDVGSNVVKLSVYDIYGNLRTVMFQVQCVQVSISSTFDSSTPYSGDIIFQYTPVGAVEKTIYFVLDGQQIGSNVTSISGRQLSYTIPQQSHGAHTFECYFSCIIDGQLVESNHLNYEFISVVQGNVTPIIVSEFDAVSVPQYTTLNVDYIVYDPANMPADVTITLNGVQTAALSVDRTRQMFTYRADTVGMLTFRIVCGNAYKDFSLSVTASDINVEAETDQLKLFLSSKGRSNNETHPEVWTYGTGAGVVEASLTGFNFASDGWQNDEDGITVLRVSGDARVVIPYQIFATDFRGTGKTIEIEFATHDVMNYDSTILSCMSSGRGISMSAQLARLVSEQSEISMQYKEGEHVRLAFVVEKRSQNRLIYMYVNGIMSGAVQYPVNDDFSQVSPVGISIGSNDCTMDIYCIRVYDNNLTRLQILNNWIADTQDVTQMLARYARNNVYDEYGNIVIAQLPAGLPYMIIECLELPQYKGDKKTVNVTYVDPVTNTRSFKATGAQADVQGTSSQYYPRKNYKIKFKNGFTLSDNTHAARYSMRPEAIPTATFCMKADVASSEGCNNVELARLYNDTCPYKTPGQAENPAIRQGIDGFPIVIFWNNGTDTVFLGKYNFNNDKGTAEVFGFVDGDESWEIRNNTSDRVIWKSDDYESTIVDDDGNTVPAWLNDFEARYPDTDPVYTDSTQLKEFATWIKSTDTTAATNVALSGSVAYDGIEYTADTAAYRLAKFKAEIGNYVEMQSAVFYYLFTELFLMVDSRAKNAFPSFMGTAIEQQGGS